MIRYNIDIQYILFYLKDIKRIFGQNNFAHNYFANVWYNTYNT